MSIFNQFETNNTKEIEGVEVEYAPNADGSIPTFIICRMGKANKRYSKALEAATRPYRRQMELGTLDNATADRIFIGVFCDTILKGWKNIKNRDGSEIAFSKQAAVELFAKLPELYDDLQERAKSAALFRDEGIEDDAKN